MTKKVLWILIIVVIFGIYLVQKFAEDNNLDLNHDENIYLISWRLPHGNEYGDIGRLMIANGLTGCGEYYVKEIVTDEYAIACTGDGLNWTYYHAWLNTKSIYLFDSETESKLNPPR